MYWKIRNWLKWRLAGDELKEFYEMKKRASEVKIWCSHNPLVTKTAAYIENPTTYPYQCFGYHGGIEDFRRYIDKLSIGLDDE